MKARNAGRRFVPLQFRDLCPVVAMVWPLHYAEHLFEWSQGARFQGMIRPVRSDDAAIGLWKREAQVQVLVAIPSLVQHLDDCPSTIGKAHKHGLDKGRVAWWFAQDAADYDWSK